jgi:hypothetical protein
MDGPVLAIGRGVTPLSQGALQQMIEQTDEKAEAAHRRLREDLDKIDQRFSVLAASQAEMRLALLKAATPDVTSLRWNSSTVLAIIMFLITLGGGFLTLRDAISDLKKGQELQRIQLESLAKTVIAQGVKP